MPILSRIIEPGNSISTFEPFNSLNAWGLSSGVDIYNCDPEIIRDENLIKLYMVQLCDLIDTKRMGESLITSNEGEKRTEGFSVVQMIENSVITGRFANHENSAYIDIFSCKYFDPEVVAHFSVSFFKGSNYYLNVNLRR